MQVQIWSLQVGLMLVLNLDPDNPKLQTGVWILFLMCLSDAL